MKNLIAIVFLLFITACGFQPMYGSSGNGAQAESVSAKLSLTEVATIPDRNGQMLRNTLVQKMYSYGGAVEKYRLTVSLRSDMTNMGLQRDATATLTRLNMTADFILEEKATGKTLLQSSSKSTVVFNILSAQYGSIVNEKDAERRAINDIASDITTKLAAHFSRVG